MIQFNADLQEKCPSRKYQVRALFPNANADFSFEIAAKNKTNAIWVAAERLRGTGASIGDIKSISF